MNNASLQTPAHKLASRIVRLYDEADIRCINLAGHPVVPMFLHDSLEKRVEEIRRAVERTISEEMGEW